MVVRWACFCGHFGHFGFRCAAHGRGGRSGGAGGKKDLAAPITAVNHTETERLKEEASRQTLLEVSEDPDYHLLNQAIILRVEENITGILNLLRLSIMEEVPEGGRMRPNLFQSPK